MSFEESVKAEIAYRLVSEFVKERDRVAQGDHKSEVDYRREMGILESLIEALPPPKAQEVNANEYPPAEKEHWSIPVFHPWEFLIGTVEQPIGPIAPMVETVNLKRELWGRGDIYAWVWSGYHERTNTIFFAVLPARPQAAVSAKR
jgi:hypothetical protein